MVFLTGDAGHVDIPGRSDSDTQRKDAPAHARPGGPDRGALVRRDNQGRSADTAPEPNEVRPRTLGVG